MNFAESMVLGMKTLTFSASFFEDGEEEPGKVEKWLTEKLGDKADKFIMTLTMILSVGIALVIFMWLPLFLAGFLKRFIMNETLEAVLEGVLRVVLFILYIRLISRMEDIRRTFMYHGAEHKCINCIEHGLPLTVDNAAGSSKEHKRCGTSFIFIVMIITILFFVVIRVDNVLLKMCLRLLLIPVIAGVSYEVLRFAGRHDSKFVDLISKPGLLMQGLTTLEPDRDMIEVAIAAVEQVFDWKAYLRENFPDTVLCEEEIPSEETAADTASGIASAGCGMETGK